jgi:hypothetical protein
MILDLTKCAISQTQALNLIDDLEQIEETLAQALRPEKIELTPDERQLLITKLRTTAAQLMNLANQINLTHY